MCAQPDGSFNKCDKTEFCFERNPASYPLFDDIESIHNWITMADLYCVDKYYISIIGSLYFVGVLFACLTTIRLPDIYGRRKQVIYVFASDILLYTSFIFAYNLYALYALSFIFGFLTASKYYTMYLWLLEFMPSVKWEAFASSFVFFCDAWNLISLSVYFWVISKYFWKL